MPPKILLLLSITYPEEQDTQLRRWGGGGGYSNIFIHMLAKIIFRVSKISILVCFGVFREMNIFGGMKILGIFLGFIT